MKSDRALIFPLRLRQLAEILQRFRLTETQPCCFWSLAHGRVENPNGLLRAPHCRQGDAANVEDVGIVWRKITRRLCVGEPGGTVSGGKPLGGCQRKS